MKAILKIIVYLLIGGLIGLLIGGLIVVLFTDSSWNEYIQKYYTVGFSEGIAVLLVAIAALIISFLILVPIHELGHLVCGLLTGYKFVSFRIFNFTLLKTDGKFKIKRFAIAGTGGQCLLSPPEQPIDEIPTGWYNFGGLLANLVVLVIALPFFLLDLNPFVAEALTIFVATDALMILLNGIPVQVGGVGNDAYNMRLLKKSRESKIGIINQLRANSLIQSGVRPKDMPDEYFISVGDIDYSNALEVSIPLMDISRRIDRMEYEEALKLCENLYSHNDRIMPLYVKEIACELAFLYMRTGNIEQAKQLLDDELCKYIETYRKMISSKERIHAAMALYIENNATKTLYIYKKLKDRKDKYLLQGEVSSDLDLIEDMLGI